MESPNPYQAPTEVTVPVPVASESTPYDPINPWNGIWLQPRRTIRTVVEMRPTWGMVPIASAYGIGEILDNASEASLGDRLPLFGVLLTAIALGPLVGLIGLHIYAFIIRFASVWLGGVADFDQVRAAIVWGQVPSIAGSLTSTVFLLLVFGAGLFRSDAEFSDTRLVATIIAGVVVVASSIWGLITMCHTLGEVSHFSAWRGLGALLLGGLVILVPILSIVVFFAFALS